MASKEDIEELIAIKQRRLQKLKEQESLYGISVDPRIPIEREDIEAEIASLQARLLETNTTNIDLDAPKPLDFDDYSPYIPRFFFGRQEELTEIKTASQTHNIIIIGGIAGIGKTYLAAEFAQQSEQDYSILWLNCESYPQLERVLASLASYFESHFNDPSLLNILRLPTADESQRINSLVRLLNQYACIFIWDGFDQNKNSSFLPLLEVCSNKLKVGKLIITTRQWMSTDEYNLLNPPYHIPPISRLDRSASISLMKSLGVNDVPQVILEQAYNRVDGHPKFLTILVGLSKKFPLPDLLDELPYVPNKVYEYLQQKIFETLEPEACLLLGKLSMLRTPFQVSAIRHMMQPPQCYEAFEILLNRYLVNRQSQNTSWYGIHDLIKEFSNKQIDRTDIPAIHKQIYSYYDDLLEPTYTDVQEGIYHALQADMLDEAYETIEQYLGATQHFGAYDLILEYSSELLLDDRVKTWGPIHHVRGRALRFKERFSEALDAYESALKFASNTKETEAAKTEIASVLVKRHDQDTDSGDLNKAREYFLELSQSSNPQVKLPAMGALGDLEIKEGKRKGIKRLKEALNLAKEAKLSREIAYLSFALGTAYYLLDNDRSHAIEYIEQSRSIQENTDEFGGANPEAWYATNVKLGDLYGDEGMFAKAADAHRECVEIDRYLKLEPRLAASLYSLGREECRLGNYEQALKFLLESLSLVETHNIQAIAKRAIYEWLTVAYWNLGEYEQAMEYGMDYINLCESEGITPNPHPVILEQGLMSGYSPLDSYKMGGHILVLPLKYDLTDVEKWKRKLISRRSDLAKFSIEVFQKPYETGQTNFDVEIGRNDPCYCGSGKKYKHCCMHRKKTDKGLVNQPQ